MGDTELDGVNGILRNETIAVPLKNLISFWGLLEMPLINFKVELKLRWTKHYVLTSKGTGNDGANSNNVVFTIKNTKLYAPVVTLSAKDNQKSSKLLSIGFEKSVY